MSQQNLVTVLSKTCTRCNVTVPATTEHFHRYVKSKDGLYHVCKECRKIETKQYLQTHKEKIREKQKEYYSRNLEKLANKNREWRKNNAAYILEKARRYSLANKEQLTKYQKKYREANKDNNYFQRILKKFGVSREDFFSLFNTQNGLCAICSVPFSIDKDTAKNVCVDHNHETGEVRGLLCRYCNSVLGFSKDSISILDKAKNYLVSKGSYGKK